MAGIGIVAGHGDIPQVSYGFQDQVAEQLRPALEKYAQKITVSCDPAYGAGALQSGQHGPGLFPGVHSPHEQVRLVVTSFAIVTSHLRFASVMSSETSELRNSTVGLHGAKTHYTRSIGVMTTP